MIYGANTPLFNKLISILSQGPINKETQIQIETFLNNQGLELSKLPHKNHVPSKLVNFFLEIQPKLTILIENYKKRLKSADLNGLSLKEKRMCNLSSEFLIAIILGCLLQIISNNNIINNKTRTLEVTVALGKDITFKYISECYKYKKNNSKDLKFYEWKQENLVLLTEIEDTQFRFELGQILLNIMVDLKLVSNIVKVLGRDEKQSILVVGSELKNLLPNLSTSSVIEIIKKKIPMVTKPNLYKLGNGDYLEFGGYLLNGIEYTDKIILSNWELSSESKLLDKNKICDMVT